MEQMKTRIDLEALSDEAIEDLSLSMDDLWMVKAMDTVFGPFDTNSLKEYSQTHQYLFEEAMAQNFQEQEWKSFFQFLQFQRRIPRLVPAQSLVSNDNFLIVHNGNKEGPYTLEVLKAKVDAGAISVRSEVSVDNGDTWIKLYEHHEFDRRSRSKPGELPFTPKEESFQSSEGFALKKIQEKKHKQEEEDALVGLAFVSTGNDKGQKVKDLTRKKEVLQKEPELKVKKTKKLPSFNMARFAAGFTVFALIGGYLFMGEDSQKVAKSPVKTKRAKVITQTKGIDNSERSHSQKTSEQKRKPASIKRLEPTRAQRHEFNHRKANWRPTDKLKISDPKMKAEIERDRNIASDENYYRNDDPREEYRDPRDSNGGSDQGNRVNEPQAEKYFNPDAYQDEQEVLEMEEERRDDVYEQVQDFE